MINNFYHYENINGEYQLITQEFIKTLDLFSDIYPEFVDIDNDNDLDLFIGTDIDMSSFPWSGKVKYYENIASNENGPIWMLINNELLGGNFDNNLALSSIYKMSIYEVLTVLEHVRAVCLFYE